MRALIAVCLATITSSLYALSAALQALEARAAPADSALRASLLAGLVRQRVWLLGGLAGVVGWGLQAVALALASVSLVQPALGLGLVVLLFLGGRLLGERVGAREIAGAVAITGSIAVLGWAAPSQTGSFTKGGTWAVGIALPVVALLPYALRALRRAGGLATSIAAGLGWAWVGLGTALVDVSIADHRFLVALAWGAGVAIASWSALLSEMTALQAWPATRAIPVSFGLEMAAPAAAAPFLTHHGFGPLHGVPFVLALVVACAGAAAVGGSRSVARAVVPLTEP
jgi:drug/metabolite transporter (DMT)-like permease